jgi:threonine aldolase
MNPVDLRSDTVTRPSPRMRQVMAAAEVGDDALGDDPSVHRLEEHVAGLLGKERAVFFPTGVMANEVTIALYVPRGEEVIAEATSHFVDWELGAAGALSGVQLRTVPAPGGLLTAALVEGAIRPPGALQIRSRLICLENTHNAAGGRILPLESMREIREIAIRHDLPVYLDGSRLWNAAVATGIAERSFADLADTVMVGLSKGLGAPVGSVLASDAALMDEARRLRRRFGGAMRQAGILAAAGLFAIENNRDRLADDHARARRLGDLCADIDGITVVPPDTNILMLDVSRPGLDAPAVVQRLAVQGILVTAFTRSRVRAVTHLDVGDDDIDRAARAIRLALQN